MTIRDALAVWDLNGALTMVNMPLRLDPRAQLQTDEEDGTAVLIDGHSGLIFSCNDTAQLVASRLASGATTDELVDALVATFEVTSDRALRDLETFLNLLGTMGLLADADAKSSEHHAA